MDTFFTNSNTYTIQAENEVASILSNFSTEYINGVIGDILEDRLNSFSTIGKPNYVIAYESNFKNMMLQYPSDKDNIIQVRNDTYREIVDMIANAYKIEVIYDDDVDIFTLARYMYDFFISNYNIYICNFFVAYINREKDGLYSSLNLDESKKSKDISTIYNKKMYSDIKIAIINANLDKVISFISTLDFSMEDILEFIYVNDQYVIRLFSDHLRPYYNLYKSMFIPMISNPNIYPMISTIIKLNLQTQNVPQQYKFVNDF